MRHHSLRWLLGTFLLIFILVMWTPQGKGWVKTFLFIPQILEDSPIKPQEFITATPIREKIKFPVAVGESEADLYLPQGSGKHPAVLFYMGVVPPDRDEKRIVALGEALARSGVIVMIPWLQTQAENKIIESDINSLVKAFEYLTTMNRVDSSKVGMSGICTGASMLAVAAQDPRISSNIKFLNFFAGYYDATDLVRAVSSRTSFQKDVFRLWEPDKLTISVLNQHLIEGVTDVHDRSILKRMFIENEDISNVQPISLGSEGFATYQLINGASLSETNDLIENLSTSTIRFLKAISPSTNIHLLKTKMFIMHDRNDRLVPYEESLRFLENYSDPDKSHYTEFSLFQDAVQVHMDEDSELSTFRYTAELFKLLRHVYLIMRELQ